MDDEKEGKYFVHQLQAGVLLIHHEEHWKNEVLKMKHIALITGE